MVQRSINEDFLRYQRTLLVLTEAIDKSKVISSENGNNGSLTDDELFKQIHKKAEIGAKLSAVK